FHQIIDRFDMNRPRHITLKRDLPKEKYVVWIDQDKMTQVLDNILSNAIKYSPDGERLHAVSLRKTINCSSVLLMKEWEFPMNGLRKYLNVFIVPINQEPENLVVPV